MPELLSLAVNTLNRNYSFYTITSVILQEDYVIIVLFHFTKKTFKTDGTFRHFKPKYSPEGVEDEERIVELVLVRVMLESEEYAVAEPNPGNQSQP